MSPETSAEEPVDLLKIDPEPSKAIYAVGVAEELIGSAREKADSGKYEDAMEDIKNAIRVASSALLYNDGYVANTLDTTCYYLQNHYPKKFPVKEWKIIEIGTKTGVKLVDTILEKLGFGKKQEARKREAERALAIAEVFVQSVKTIVMVGGTPAWEETKREE